MRYINLHLHYITLHYITLHLHRIEARSACVSHIRRSDDPPVPISHIRMHSASYYVFRLLCHSVTRQCTSFAVCAAIMRRDICDICGFRTGKVQSRRLRRSLVYGFGHGEREAPLKLTTFYYALKTHLFQLASNN